MKMTTFVPALSLCLVSLLLAGPAQGALVNFDFNNGTAFDGSGPGTTMWALAEDDTNVTMTSVDVRAPEYELADGNWTWDGTTYGVAETYIVSTLGINNLSISGDNPINNEPTNINPGESWTFSFDVDVVFTQIDFAAFSGGDDKATLEVEGESPVAFTGDDGDPLNDPLSGLVIPAGTNITITNSDTVPTPLPDAESITPSSNWRINNFTLDIVVPEPSALVLLLISGLTVIVSGRTR